MIGRHSSVQHLELRIYTGVGSIIVILCHRLRIVLFCTSLTSRLGYRPRSNVCYLAALSAEAQPVSKPAVQVGRPSDLLSNKNYAAVVGQAGPFSLVSCLYDHDINHPLSEVTMRTFWSNPSFVDILGPRGNFKHAAFSERGGGFGKGNAIATAKVWTPL